MLNSIHIYLIISPIYTQCNKTIGNRISPSYCLTCPILPAEDAIMRFNNYNQSGRAQFQQSLFIEYIKINCLCVVL